MTGVLRVGRRHACVVLALLAASCQSPKAVEQAEIARNTVACMLAGERILIRFVDRAEVRVLLPNGETANLYLVPSSATMRFTNGTIDVYGSRDSDMTIAFQGARPQPLEYCAPLAPPS